MSDIEEHLEAVRIEVVRLRSELEGLGTEKEKLQARLVVLQEKLKSIHTEEEEVNMKHGDDGKRVVTLQRKIMSAGIPLPRFGADEDFGSESYRGAVSFLYNICAMTDSMLDTYGIDPDADKGGLPAEVVQLIIDYQIPGIPNWMTDVRSLHVPVGCNPKYRRDIEKINGIVLHQKAPGKAWLLGENPRRWFELWAHFGVCESGQVIWVADLEIKKWHANYFNARTIGVEIDGHFEGVLGSDRTLWREAPRPPAELRSAQIEGARNTCRFICEKVKEKGGEIKYIWAHRQTSESREADPGESPWREVGLWAQEELGLINDVNHSRYTGKPICKQWDPRSTHDFR